MSACYALAVKTNATPGEMLACHISQCEVWGTKFLAKRENYN